MSFLTKKDIDAVIEHIQHQLVSDLESSQMASFSSQEIIDSAEYGKILYSRIAALLEQEYGNFQARSHVEIFESRFEYFFELAKNEIERKRNDLASYADDFKLEECLDSCLSPLKDRIPIQSTSR